MARESFRVHIKELEKDILQIGDMVINAVNRSIDALKNRDINEAQKIVKDDAIINNKRWTIEEKCIQLIALQQPVASDLREIVSMLSIVTDIERMGDYAEGIAKIVILLGNEPPVKPLVDIPKMAEIATSMLKRSLDAFIQRDARSITAF
jgi:phosphate transport system protein